MAKKKFIKANEEETEEELSPLEKLAEKALYKASRQLMASSDFKKPRLAKIEKFWNLYNGNVTKKIRQLFNIPIPVFPGMIDTLNSEYDTPIQLKFGEGDAADYFKVKKINGAFQMEIASTAENTKWDSKLRTARTHAIMQGVAIARYDVYSDPEYMSELSNVRLKDFHFQPRGGSNLEKHLFNGQEGVEKTKDELMKGVKSGIYNKRQVKMLLSRASESDYLPNDNLDWGEKLERFKPLGLNPDNSSYVGEPIFKFVDWILRIDGVRYYICFDPWTMTWIRFEKWKDICSSGLYPWVSFATHEDDENFLSKAFADDLYAAADAIIGMFNQEMTNREKKNNNPKAFDKDMFTDVRRLDEVMHRPDGLIAADTKGGSRRIAEGIYEFKVAELSGTVNLIDWVSDSLGKNTGANDIAMGNEQNNQKKASVVFAEQKSVSKRIGWRSAPFQQMMSNLGKRYLWGLKDHMPSEMAIKILGPNGWDWDQITRLDLDTTKDVDILILSTDKQMIDNEMKAQKRKEALIAVGGDQSLAMIANPQWRLEEILRTAEYDDVAIAVAMDTKNFTDKKALAHAAESIQLILQGKTPQQWFGATISFIEKIIDYAVDHRGTLEDKYQTLIDFAVSHEEIVKSNIERQVMQEQRMMSQNTQSVDPTTGKPAVESKAINPGLPGGVSKSLEVGKAMV